MSYLSKLISRPLLVNGVRSRISNASKLYLNSPRKLITPQFIKHSSSIRLVPVKDKGECEPGLGEHVTFNENLGRPLSPHIRIYKKQLTSLLSFGHRLTGLMMTFYVYVVAVGTWIWPNSNDFFELMSSLDAYVSDDVFFWCHRAVRFFIAMPMAFHICNAVRHLGWDVGRFLSLKSIYSTGYMVLLISIPLAGFAIFAL